MGADDVPAENPFTQFGFTEFNPDANTPDYASKIIVQISNTLNQVFLGYTPENAASGVNSLATFNIPGGTFAAGDSLELQVNENQARLLYNGSPMMTGGVGTDYKNLPVNFFSTNFATGNQLIPFFGVIRGAVLEAGDTIGAGFDDVNARNVTLGAGVVGDANGDGEVTFADVQLIASKFREAVPQGTLGDLNANGQVDFDDFHIWKTAANSTISLGEALTSVPEPSAGTLLCVATASGAILRRRRQAS